MCLVKPSVTLLWGKYNNPIEPLITLWQRFGESKDSGYGKTTSQFSRTSFLQHTEYKY